MKLKLILLALLLILGCKSATIQITKPAETAGDYYVVGKGDTLPKIAHNFKAQMSDILEANGLDSAQKLRVGQILYIPAPGAIQTEKPAPSPSPIKTPVNPKKRKEPVDHDKRTICFEWPVKNGVMFQEFDLNLANPSEGISLGAPAKTPVKAAAKGTVMYAGDNQTRFGNMVIIRHDDPFVTIYAHLDDVKVKKGQAIKQGEIIGTVGTSGGVESPRVQFQVRKNRNPVDPVKYLSK